MIRRLWGRIAAAASDPPRPRVEDGYRVYAIGDVHGRDDLLLQLLDRIAEDAAMASPRVFRLVLLGDYVDRGIGSCGVIAILRRLHEEMRTSVRFLCGNHEAAMLAFLDDPVAGSDWLSIGGRQTLESYGVRPPGEGDAPEQLAATRDALRAAMGRDEAFLRNMLVRWGRSGETLFVHAAIDPGKPLDEQTDEALLWGRAPAFYERGGPPGLTVVHGHTSAPEPDLRPWRIGVDTGAVFSGRLTAVRIDDAGFAFLHT